MNFGELKASLLEQIGRAPSDLCYDLVTSEINENVRIAEMQTTVSFAPVAEYELPGDYLEDVSVYHENGGNRRAMEALEPAAFDAFWSQTAYPAYYSISDGVMRVNGTEGGGSIVLRYYRKQAKLTSGNDTNNILNNHPAVYVYGVLAHHAALIRDQTALTVHFTAYERAVEKMHRADIAMRMGGNIAGPRVRSAP